MALTIFLIFIICWLFWQNTKLYRTTQILLKEIKKRGKIIEEDVIALENGTRTVKELTAKYKKLSHSHVALKQTDIKLLILVIKEIKKYHGTTFNFMTEADALNLLLYKLEHRLKNNKGGGDNFGEYIFTIHDN